MTSILFATLVTVTMLLAATCSGCAAAQDIPIVSDGFDDEQIKKNWQLFQIKSYRHWPERTYVRTGDGSRAIRAKGGDVGDSCDNPCQRSEIRLKDRLRAPYDQVAYYGFSFQVRDEVSTTDSHRLVIGQWKGDGSEGSPFLAQRFDNRIFHVTVQDNDCRTVVAAAEGDIEAFLNSQLVHDYRPPAFVADPELYRCKPRIMVECFVAQCRLPDPYERWTNMVYSVKGGRDGNGEVVIWADGDRIARVTGRIGNDDDGSLQKFKFGIYRKDRSEKTTIYLDNFRQNTSFATVDPATFPD